MLTISSLLMADGLAILGCCIHFRKLILIPLFLADAPATGLYLYSLANNLFIFLTKALASAWAVYLCSKTDLLLNISDTSELSYLYSKANPVFWQMLLLVAVACVSAMTVENVQEKFSHVQRLMTTAPRLRERTSAFAGLSDGAQYIPHHYLWT